MTTPSEFSAGRDATTHPSLAKNTAFNIASSLVRLLIGLVVSPILFWKLGAETYGLWSVIWAFTGFLALADFRLGYATTPLIAAAQESGDSKQVKDLANTGLFVYVILGASAVVIAFALMQFEVTTAWLPDYIEQDIVFIVPAAVTVFACTTIITLLSGILYGLQRYDITSKIAILVDIVRAFLLVGIALAGGGLRDLVLAEAGIALLKCLLLAVATRRSIPGFGPTLSPKLAVFRELFSFGLKLEVAHITHLLSLHLDKLLLTAFLGLEAVAFYDLGAKVVGVARTMPLLLVSATLPVVSTLETAGERKRLREFFEKGTSILSWCGLPIFVWAVVCAGPLLFAWAGITELEARVTVWILSFGFFLSVYSGMANSVIIGIGKPELEMKRSILAGFLNIVLSSTLIQIIGFPGAPMGTSLAVASGSVYLTASVYKYFDRPLYQLIKPLLPALLPILPSATGAYLILWIAGVSRGGAIIGVAGAALFVGFIYLLAGMRYGIISRAFYESVRYTTKPKV